MMNYTIEEKEVFMREALKEAEIALAHDEIPIGCVLVKEGKIIGRGHNARVSCAVEQSVWHAFLMLFMGQQIRNLEQLAASTIF